MKVKGNFPLPLTGLVSAWPQATWLHHPSHKVGGTLTSREKTHALMSTVNAAIVAQANSWIPGYGPESHYGPWGCTFEGTPVPNPPDKFFDLGPMGQNNVNFDRRSKEGEIIVSNYSVGQIWSKYILGYKNVQAPSPRPERSHTDTNCGLFEIERPPGYTLIRDGARDISASTHYVETEYRYIDISVSPYDVGWNDAIFDQMLRLHKRGPIDSSTGMITEVTAEANRVILDAMTAAAEMPETIKSIYSACTTVVRLYKDAKKREFRMYDKIKRIQGLSESEMAAAQKAKAIKDLTDAIADVWLNFRYNIMPNVYLIEDLLKVLDNVGKNFFRFRGFQQEQLSFDTLDLPKGWSGSFDYTSDSRICIKRSYAAGENDWRHLVQSNLFVTAWELVPLSFVYDWVLNIGNTLGALLSPNLNFEEGATFSWKTDHSFTFKHDQSNAQVVAQLRFYDRAVINPSDYCRLVINIDFGLLRQLDAMALAWKMLTQRS